MRFLFLFFLIPVCAYSQTFDELLAAGDYNKAEAVLKALDSGKWRLPKNKATFLTDAGALHLNKGRQDLALGAPDAAGDGDVPDLELTPCQEHLWDLAAVGA